MNNSFPVLLKNIIAKTPVALAIVDTQMCYLAVSERWVSDHFLYGKLLIGKSHYEILPQTTEQWKKIYADCLNGKDQKCDQGQFEQGDGSTIWLKWEVQHWLGEDGNIGGLIMYREDVTAKVNSSLNEKRFQLFMDDLPGLCWIADSYHVLKYANKHFFETLNLSPTVVGKTMEDILGKDIATLTQLNNRDILRSRQSKEFHQTFRDKKGHLQNFKTYKFPFQNVELAGDLIGAISLNASKHERIDENPHQSEAHFRQAFEDSRVGMALITPDGRWKKVNKILCNLLGYTKKELQQLSIQDITYPEDLNESIHRLTTLAEGEINELKIEKRYLHKSGNPIWVVFKATMMKDLSGHPLHYVSQIEDITVRKELETDLLLSDKKYRKIFENVQDVFYQTDEQGLITEISPSIVQHSGYQKEEIIGKPFVNFYYYAYDRERIIESIAANGSVKDFELRLKTKNGELRYASFNAIQILEDNVLKGTKGSIRDVTTRKFSENALKTSNTELSALNEKKNRLLATISHDLKSPISGSLQLLSLTLSDFATCSIEEVKSHLLMIKDELFNANELLEDLLLWAKSQFNSINFFEQLIEDLPAIFHKCIQNILPMTLKKGIQINYHAEEGLSLNADKGMLETIIRNLLSNAVKFTSNGGKVSITAISHENGIKFSVADNGQGIPMHKIGALFDKTIHYTTYGTAGEKGTGLGLNLCYDFVLRHGGKLWAESEVGIGSTFYMTIPNSS